MGAIAASARVFPAPFTPFDMRFEAPQLRDDQLWRGSAFEWWYFDLETDDGIELIVTFNRRNPVFSTEGSALYVKYRDGVHAFDHLETYARNSFAWSADGKGAQLRILD